MALQFQPGGPGAGFSRGSQAEAVYRAVLQTDPCELYHQFHPGPEGERHHFPRAGKL